MRTPPRKRFWTLHWIAVPLTLLLLVPSVAPRVSADDIPHENYDLIGSNLDVVISLLNSSIDFSESALKAMYNESMDSVEQNLSVVRGILGPAERLIGEIQDVASSYENLSRLLPPFASLSNQEDLFAGMEKILLEARDELLIASRIENLTEPDMLRALENVKTVNSLLLRMNDTIDEMLVSAGGIIDLTVDARQPFAQNRLIPLIEKLRDLLYTIKLQVESVINGPGPIINWNKTRPFLLLWLDRTEYYLGDEIKGGGYLYFNGSFSEDHEVQVMIDTTNMTLVRTTYGGVYSFAWRIPLNSTYLGSHSVESSAIIPNGTLHSNTVSVTISLIPTRITLRANTVQLNFDEDLVASVTLIETAHTTPLADASCHFVLDAEDIPFATSQSGTFQQSWPASELGFGEHTIQAIYDPELPYAGSVSPILTIEVSIPTDVTLELFSKRFYTGYYVVGSGALTSNGTQPMAGAEITLFIDGEEIVNVTTDATGGFAFSIPTENMTLGGHILRAAFLHHAGIWRYSQAEVGFTVFGLKVAKYPFWPVIPGWGGIAPPESFPYLFVGSNAYFGWLLVIILLAVVLRTLQMSKRLKELARKATTEAVIPLQETPVPSLVPASAEDIASIFSKEWTPTGPNERVIWYYHTMLDFLRRKRRIQLQSSMTHWEVAQVLNTLGFSVAHVRTATTLFEQALYSGTNLSNGDAAVMSSTMIDLLGPKEVKAVAT